MKKEVVFLGTGTSQGVPVIACGCAVCQSTDSRDKRLRSSVLIRYGAQQVVIDTGPDFREQMLRLGVQDLHGVVFTHSHKDHVAGLDDVRAFNYKYHTPMPIWADAYTLQRLEGEFPYIFDGTNYPGIPQIDRYEIDTAPFEAAGVPFLPVPVLHYRMPVLGFRIDNLAYVTDANYISPESKALLVGLDVLVLNALRREPHISHLLGTHEEVSAELPARVQLAYDGLTVAFE